MHDRRWPEGVLPKKVVTTWKKIYAELASEEHGTAMRFVIDKTQFLCNTEGRTHPFYCLCCHLLWLLEDISGTVYLKLAYETQIRGLFVCFEVRRLLSRAISGIKLASRAENSRGTARVSTQIFVAMSISPTTRLSRVASPTWSARCVVTYNSAIKLILGIQRENLVLPAGSHQFSFRIPVPAATDTGSPMERSVPNYSVRKPNRASGRTLLRHSECLLLP